jgi:NADPH2:quinone reductase
MRALRVHELGGIDRLRLDDVPVPEPGPGEVRVRAEAVGVNFADILMIAGRYQLRPELPFSPGFEVAGVVDAAGDGVAAAPPGTRVAGAAWYGAYAEQVVLPASRLVPLPGHIDAVTAVASMVSYGTAHHALTDRGDLREGESLFVTGATGGVGSAAVQIGKMMGAKVIAGVGSPAKRDRARSLGADDVVVYGNGDTWREQLASATGGKGVDVVFEVVGGDVFAGCARALGPGGRLLVVGFASGDIPEVAANMLLLKEASIAGVFWGAFRDREPERAETQLEVIWQCIGDGTLARLPTETYALEEAGAALKALSERAIAGKAILLPGERKDLT